MLEAGNVGGLSTKMLQSTRFSCNLKICLSAIRLNIKFFLMHECFLFTTLSLFNLKTCESSPVTTTSRYAMKSDISTILK